MTKPPFTHLHVHTQYSLLDGAARLKDMFAACNEMGMSHIAMTDHGNLHGAYDFFHSAQKANVTPIIGIEAYVAPESRKHKRKIQWGQPHQKRDDVSGSGGYTHKTIWASNAKGLHNLFKLSSDAYAEGWLQKWPRMDKETIAQWSEGLIASTGCPSGEVQTRLRLGQFDEAVQAASDYKDIFGEGKYFLELMDHGIEIERRVRDGLLEIGKKLNIPPLVTNDSHYTYAHEATAHDALLCIQTGKNLSDPDRFRFDGTGYYLKTADEMYAVDSSDAWQEGCANTLLVAQQIDTTGMFEKRDLMPKFDIPDGFTEITWFQEEVRVGMNRRFPGGVPEDRQKQVEYEMDIIIQMGFPGYFLVVADFIMWAKNNGIAVGPGRGSAAGSIVAYAMGITDLDPIEHGLIFERFLNPERVSMPDVDIDFDERRRVEVIRYVTEKYGADKVAMIGTYGKIKAKNAIKDSARVLGYPYAMGDRLTKAMPADVLGKGIDLNGITDPKHPRYSEAGEIRGMYENEPDVKKVIDTAKGVEGLVRQMGVHAAGVIMSSEPIVDHAPIWVRHTDGVTITQWDYPQCESLGLLKMDFLGLRNLTIMDDAVKMVESNKGVKLDLLGLPLDDPKTYEMLCRGDTLGVFQFDGGPMRSLLRQMQPDNFEDISAVSALYRPGPMGMNSHTNYAERKNGRQEITPIHPELEEPLKEVLGLTYGLIVYQEQVQKAAQIVAGYSLGEADILRRVMGKKKPEELAKNFVLFEAGAKEKGFSDAAIKALWDVLVPFAGYAFNKAHSSAYGLVTYWTAYLKANYPAEYMAALLTSVKDDKDKSAVYLNECRRMGIKVLPPNVNESLSNFAAQGDDVILFGLTAVRNVGQNVVDSIIRCRKAKGKYSTFPDFLDKVEAVVCNKAHRRIADQGRRLRRDGPHPQGPGRPPRTHDRQRGAGQAQGGRGPVRPLRRHGRGGERRAGLRARRGVLRHRVGEVVPAGPGARDARAVRLRPPALRPGARAVRQGGLLDLPADRRRARRRRDRHRRRHHLRPPAQDDQAGQRLGHRHRRGPGRFHRVHVLPGHLPAGLHPARRGHRRLRQGTPRQAGGRAPAGRHGDAGTRHLQRRHQRPRGADHPHRQDHPAHGQPPRRGPQQPPGRHRGTDQAPGPPQDHGAPARPAPGEAGPGALR
ncbi:DNA polymerase-3 subunit alpha [Streptomyces sp. TE4109]